MHALLFPGLTLVFSAVAFLFPGLFVPLKTAIVPLLGVIMFSMGLTLRGSDFVSALRRYRVVALGVALQYLVMPLTALVVGKLLSLETDLLAGLVLVGCCPGGTASNVIAYLAKADVALSITLTAVATLVSIVATPSLTWWLIGQSVEVNVGKMLINLVLIVLFPVTAGGILNRLFADRVKRIEGVLPVVSMLAIVMVIAIVVALNRDRLDVAGAAVFLAVAIHNAIGLAVGYGVARSVGCDMATCRTIGIEVGMQNSGLGVALAIIHFNPLAALPGAIFSVWHNLSGTLLASFWREKIDPDRPGPG